MTKKLILAFVVITLVSALSSTAFANTPSQENISSERTLEITAKNIMPVDTTDIAIGKYNNNIIFGTNKNEAVLAAKNGTIVFADYNLSAGYEIRIEHDDGFTSVYSHLDKTYFRNNKIEIGKSVLAGDTIGETGDSGATTGNKCVFALLKSDTLRNLDDTETIKSADFEGIKQINEFLG